MPAATKRIRTRGSIDTLPSGALRVRVYAGRDPLTKRDHYLVEIVPPGPKAAAEAEKMRTRLLSQVDEQRSPRTRATVNQLMDRYLDVLDVDQTTRLGYVGYIDKHIRPQLGSRQVGKIDAEVLDAFYASLRTCRENCRGRIRIDHRTPLPHECHVVKHRRRTVHECAELGCRTFECQPHRCRPLAASTVRQIHWILSGAFNRAVRWRWLTLNPIDLAMPPAAPQPKPQPPSAHEAAQLATEAWKDPAWGTFVWLAMTTGARRGELCALRWSDLELANAVIHLHASIAQARGRQWTKDTKTHQQRRVALDPETVAVLTEHLERSSADAHALGLSLLPDAYVFSRAPDGSTPVSPDSVSQRYRKMAIRLGLDTLLKSLRHYSATELVSSGADVRTVAGRLGHGGGGTTTLRVYAAWVSEADQRAANALGPRMPARPKPRTTE
jgi:integrase